MALAYLGRSWQSRFAAFLIFNSSPVVTASPSCFFPSPAHRNGAACSEVAQSFRDGRGFPSVPSLQSSIVTAAGPTSKTDYPRADYPRYLVPWGRLWGEKCHGVSAPISQRLHFQLPTAPFHTGDFFFVCITKNSLLTISLSPVSPPLELPLLSPCLSVLFQSW